MNVDVAVPALGSRPVASLIEGLRAAPRVAPWADETIDLLATFAADLLKDPRSRAYPELVTLGFFLRRSELLRLRGEYLALERPDVVRVPHGLVVHVPPANVDTIFVYSWALSVLAGNTNVVRLSSRVSPVVELLVELLAAVLDRPGFAAARERVVMVRYGHEDPVTARWSAEADLRVVWGGDRTVRTLRAFPLPPHARELTFPDRWSFTALGASAVAELGPAGLKDLAEALFNDIFWFDQLGCSSPRLVVWRGPPDVADLAASRLWPAVAEVVRARGRLPAPATRMARELFAHQAALDGAVTGRTYADAALDVLRVDALTDATREHPGGGMLFELVTPELDVLEGFVRRRDQTMTTFGLDPAELRDFVLRLGGRGLDRVVPVGRALAMGRFWDGHDLLRAFVRDVHLSLGS